MPLTRCVYALTHEELEALCRLQEGSPVPGSDDPVWGYLVSLGLVWMDAEVTAADARSTSSDRGYATD